MTPAEFDLDSGDLSLDFANSQEWRASDYPDEKLNDITDLVAWGEAAGILTPAQAGHLRRLAARQSQKAAAAYAWAIQIREAIYRIFSNLSAQKPVEPDDLNLLNQALQQSLSHIKLAPASDGFNWEWADGPVTFEQILWPVVRAAADLLTSDHGDRVHQCEDDRGCSYLFIDQSRNRSRRWCSMESCGNRAKARRHYARQTGDQIGEG